MVHVIQVCRQLSSRTIVVLLKAVYKHVRHISLLSVQWINAWWWTKELSETFTVSCQNKFVKLVHLFGFIIKKFVTMQHGHTNVKTIPNPSFFRPQAASHQYCLRIRTQVTLIVQNNLSFYSSRELPMIRLVLQTRLLSIRCFLNVAEPCIPSNRLSRNFQVHG